jgi:hypothetical protein
MMLCIHIMNFLSGFYAMALIGLRIKFIVHSHNNDGHLPNGPIEGETLPSAFFLDNTIASGRNP